VGRTIVACKRLRSLNCSECPKIDTDAFKYLAVGCWNLRCLVLRRCRVVSSLCKLCRAGVIASVFLCGQRVLLLLLLLLLFFRCRRRCVIVRPVPQVPESETEQRHAVTRTVHAAEHLQESAGSGHRTLRVGECSHCTVSLLLSVMMLMMMNFVEIMMTPTSACIVNRARHS
jgi:hypothetical protein